MTPKIDLSALSLPLYIKKKEVPHKFPPFYVIILLYWEKFSQINGYNNVNCTLGAQNFKVFSISDLLKERSFEISSGPDSSLDRQ